MQYVIEIQSTALSTGPVQFAFTGQITDENGVVFPSLIFNRVLSSFGSTADMERSLILDFIAYWNGNSPPQQFNFVTDLVAIVGFDANTNLKASFFF